MGSVGGGIARGLEAVVSLGGSEIARSAQKSQADSLAAANAANMKAMADIQGQQQKFAKEQEDALKAQPVKEDPMEAYGSELQTRLRRLRAGFQQNLKTGPMGLLTAANTKTPALNAGQKLLGG